MEFTDVHLEFQRSATYALLKFCQERNRQCKWVRVIQHCFDELERGDVEKAFRHFRKVPLGGMGCFNDWYPPVIFDHEDKDYVHDVFDALCERWSRLMALAAKE